MLRDTFMGSQGRQYAQIPLIDAIVRTWREAELSVELVQKNTPDLVARIASMPLPRRHISVIPPERVRIQFVMWWELTLRIIDYIYQNDAASLPAREFIDRLIEDLGGESYMQSFIEEEICAIEVMFQRYRTLDPKALMSSSEAIEKFVVKALIESDRYWVSDPGRKRPGRILRHPNESMLPVLLGESIRKRAQGRRLTDCEELYGRVSDLLVEIQVHDPTFDTVLNYRKLLAEYHDRHPDSPLTCLHLPSHVSMKGSPMQSLSLHDVVQLSLHKAVRPSNYTMDCFVTSEIGHNDVIAKCRPGVNETSTHAYVGVGPCQNLTYIGALRPRLAIICDSRLDNLIEHLMFKMLIERARDPLDYLLLLFSRVLEDRPPNTWTSRPEDLLSAFELGTSDLAEHRDNLEWLRSEAKRRWEFDGWHLDRLAYLYGEFFARQLAITAVNKECADALGSPTLRDVILARNTYRRNFHFLADADRFAYVRRMHLENRIIPLLGNFCSPASIELINRLLTQFNERADTIYLSNIEDHVLGRYVLDANGVASEPNPDGLLTGAYAQSYGGLVDQLAAIRTTTDAMLIRFVYQAERWGRTVGEDLEPVVSRLETFFGAYHRGPASLLDTCL
jgi:hypothetical protein